MPLKIESKPITKEFRLKADPSGETFVIIRQATVGDNQRRYNLLANVTFVMMSEENGGDREIKQRINFFEQMRLDAFLTLGDCNIMSSEDEGLFKFHKGKVRDQREFEAAWDSLPPAWAEEIHKYVLSVNPDWDPTRGDFPPLE